MGNGEFIENEKIGINALDLCSIMGVNKNKSLYDVYLEKTSNENLLEKKREISEAFYWDCTIKEMLCKEYSVRSVKKVRKENKLITDEEYDFMTGYIDRRVVGENSILICKSENAFFPPQWKGEEIPVNYLLECQHNMRIFKANKCYIISLIYGKKFIIKEVLRDENMIDMIIKIEKDFWFNNVLKKVPPKERSIGE